MTSHYLPINSIPLKVSIETDQLPSEGLAILAIGLVAYAINFRATPVIIGLGVGLIGSNFAIKTLERYHRPLQIKVTKWTCRLVNRFPNIRMISLVFALAVNCFSPPFGALLGCAIGAFAAILLDVLHYKQLQQTKRQQMPALN